MPWMINNNNKKQKQRDPQIRLPLNQNSDTTIWWNYTHLLELMNIIKGHGTRPTKLQSERELFFEPCTNISLPLHDGRSSNSAPREKVVAPSPVTTSCWQSFCVSPNCHVSYLFVFPRLSRHMPTRLLVYLFFANTLTLHPYLSRD